MKKIALLVLTASCILSTIRLAAQDETAFDKGTVVATAGYGFLNPHQTGVRVIYDSYNPNKVSGFGPFIIKGDYGIVKFKWGHCVGAGIVLGYSNTKVRFEYREYEGPSYRLHYQTDSYNTITAGVRGTYHFFTKKNLDCYVSIGFGSHFYSYTNRATDDARGPISVYDSRASIYSTFTAGIRYYFTKNFGVYSELGRDMSTLIQGGLALKL